MVPHSIAGMFAVALTLALPMPAAENTALLCPGAYNAEALSINSHNQVVGWCETRTIGDIGVIAGFLWDRGDYHLIRPDYSGNNPSMALGINDSGVILGEYVDEFENEHGFLIVKGQIVDFAPLASRNTIPAAINASGAVAGTYEDNAGVTRGFIRDFAGTYTLFSFPVTNSPSYTITGLNDLGQITGWGPVSLQSGVEGFVRDSDGTISFFVVPGTSETLPSAINNSGTITGYATNTTVGAVGFVRDPSGAFTTFTSPSAGSTGATQPTSINDSGEIVGVAFPATGTIRSFTWSGTGTPAEFQIGLGSYPWKINSSGRIVGWASKGITVRGFFRDVLPPAQ